jgi:hypothetical protein
MQVCTMYTFILDDCLALNNMESILCAQSCLGAKGCRDPIKMRLKEACNAASEALMENHSAHIGGCINLYLGE